MVEAHRVLEGTVQGTVAFYTLSIRSHRRPARTQEGGSGTPDNVDELQARIKELEAERARSQAAEQLTQAQLKRFDTLDVVAYTEGVPTNARGLFTAIHTDDVTVSTGALEPDTTIGDQDAAMPPMFQMFPDHRRVAHPIAFGQGDWTCTLDVSEGTFSRPLPGPDGQQIPPTGKRFRAIMTTVARSDGERIAKRYSSPRLTSS